MNVFGKDMPIVSKEEGYEHWKEMYESTKNDIEVKGMKDEITQDIFDELSTKYPEWMEQYRKENGTEMTKEEEKEISKKLKETKDRLDIFNECNEVIDHCTKFEKFTKFQILIDYVMMLLSVFYIFGISDSYKLGLNFHNIAPFIWLFLWSVGLVINYIELARYRMSTTQVIHFLSIFSELSKIKDKLK